jgi:carbonic anhydrase
VITVTRPPADAAPSRADDVLTRLLRGNRRVQSTGVRRGAFEPTPAPGPLGSPLAAVLACADAPAPPSLLFDQPAGDLFTVRVPGPTVTPDTLADLEYAVGVLRVPLIVVLGHEGCRSLAVQAESREVEEYVRDQVRRVGEALGAPLRDRVTLVGAILDVPSLSVRIVKGA